MATTINADASSGGAVVTGDGSGVLALQAAGVTKVTINGSGVTLADPLPVSSGGTGSSTSTGSGNIVLSISPTITTPTLTTPVLSNPTINDGYTEEVYTANTGTAITLSLSNGTIQNLTLTGICTITMPAAVAGKSFMMYLRTGAGGYTVTWSTVKWSGGTAPTLTATASRMDMFSFFSDGTNWYGVVAGQNYTP